jgi:GTP cyclohydrolase IA
MATEPPVPQTAERPLIPVSWSRFYQDCLTASLGIRRNFGRWGPKGGVCGVSPDGCVAAVVLAAHLTATVLDRPRAGCLLVDATLDDGRPFEWAINEVNWRQETGSGCGMAAVYKVAGSPSMVAFTCLTLNGRPDLPWHTSGTSDAENAVRTLLREIGDDPTRDGLRDTPARVLRSFREMTAGARVNPADVLRQTFEVQHDEMVVLRDVAFTSVCEHHLLPFVGEVSIGYLPGKVVGISKLARLVECYARRLQVQERLTTQLADAVERHLEAKGVGVLVSALHSCMSCRGVKQAGARMITSAVRGAMKDEGPARAEWLNLARLR